VTQAIGGVLAGFLAVACGWLGEVHHIGFTVSSRSAWGMRGAFCKYRPYMCRLSSFPHYQIGS
jgi:cytosine/uracil/thiamine/allantoin permease